MLAIQRQHRGKVLQCGVRIGVPRILSVFGGAKDGQRRRYFFSPTHGCLSSGESCCQPPCEPSLGQGNRQGPEPGKAVTETVPPHIYFNVNSLRWSKGCCNVCKCWRVHLSSVLRAEDFETIDFKEMPSFASIFVHADWCNDCIMWRYWKTSLTRLWIDVLCTNGQSKNLKVITSVCFCLHPPFLACCYLSSGSLALQDRVNHYCASFQYVASLTT